tara:strand:- start:149 stop:400 length:252 start_codon:yes stop_codon:yes gene_type:complete
MNSEMTESSMMSPNMMELLFLALLFIIVRDSRVQDMVNNTLSGIMPDLQLEDEDGNSTLLGNSIHALVFVGVWWVLGEVGIRQ